jgi:hypothetical protein
MDLVFSVRSSIAAVLAALAVTAAHSQAQSVRLYLEAFDEQGPVELTASDVAVFDDGTKRDIFGSFAPTRRCGFSCSSTTAGRRSHSSRKFATASSRSLMPFHLSTSSDWLPSATHQSCGRSRRPTERS